ncbi:MAG: GNAT family N-acetyltransferase [Oscillospiraceae bacterium]|nr:GNAT family N-acetyltransferase [Oscillospiraceae bacterium]
MLEYRRIELTDDNVAQLIRLSEIWAAEGSTFGLIPNTREDIREPAFAAFDGDLIIGYAFGHYYTTERKTSCIDVGSRCFELDELFVTPEYRSKGVGGTLFKEIEREVKDKASYLTLSTATKDYKRILRFYIEDNDMFFHDAFLIKEFPQNNE